MSEVTVETVREQLAQLSAPLRAQLDQVETNLIERERELAGLRELRRELRRGLSAVDPSFAAQNGGSKKALRSKAQGVSDERVQWVLAFIREHAAEFPDGFTATGLERIAPGVSNSTFAKSLAVLHARGDIRLDHRGRGGANYWKLVA